MQLPHSRDSERLLIGCIISNQDCLNSAASALNEDDFYFPEHQLIFRVLKGFYISDSKVDIHLLTEELRRQNQLETVGGFGSLADLIHFASMSIYVDEYIKIIKDKSLLRKIIQTCKKVEKEAYSEPKDVLNTLDCVQNMFFKISQTSKSNDSSLISDFLAGKHPNCNEDFLKELEKRQEQFKLNNYQNSLVTGTPTGFIDLDKIINGISPSNLIIIAGRPGMGKTALGLNILENICFGSEKAVGVFSLEMPIGQLVNRVLSSQSEIETNKILQGNLNGSEFQKILSVVKTLERTKMVIDDQPNMNIANLRSRARRMKEKYDIHVLMIDYLQLLDSQKSGRYIENRQTEISEISRTLKNLSRELNIPVICLAQLSRKVEERPGHRPLMSDLRESGCLTSDTIIQTDKGSKPIIEIVNSKNNCTVLSANTIKKERPEIIYASTSNAFYSGKKDVMSITTQKGHFIKSTYNHKFFTPSGWVEMKDLKVGSRIYSVSDEQINEDTVLSKDILGKEDVFDITVPETSCFIANNLIAHNSIEQDADVVLFLLRKEYYDNNDKPGLAEIIIAKNRHGSTGSVELAYRNNLAKFANLLKTESSYTNKNNKKATSYGFDDFSPGF